MDKRSARVELGPRTHESIVGIDPLASCYCFPIRCGEVVLTCPPNRWSNSRIFVLPNVRKRVATNERTQQQTPTSLSVVSASLKEKQK